MSYLFQRKEQQLLMGSAAVMAAVGSAGIFMGCLSGSQAILTDGVFSSLAVVIKLMMLGTSRLIAKETSVRFQFGYWQMEPLVLFAEGVFTLLVVAIAAASGLQGLMNGGRETDFGLAAGFAVFFAVLSASFYFYLVRENRELRSNLVHFDSVSWYVDMILAFGLLLSFAAAWAVEQTAWAPWSRYADPVIMLVLSLHMIPPALRILRPSFGQMLGMSPREVHERVQRVMDESMKRYGFTDYVSSVQQYGSVKIIEIDILIDRAHPSRTIAEFDEIRNAIDRAIGYPDHQKWLTINFTASRRWMARDYLMDG